MSRRNHRWPVLGVGFAGLVWIAACSGGSGSNPSPGDAAPEFVPPDGGAEVGAVGVLTGTVKDQAGLAITGAKFEIGAASVFSDATGKFSLGKLAPGEATLKVTQSWFQPLEQPVSIVEGTNPPLAIVLEEKPLRIDPADRALAVAYNQTFDWRKQTISIALAEVPTRRAFDNAIFLHNPALYRDTTAAAPVIPTPQPDIAVGVAANFDFPVLSGANAGQQALDPATIVDAIKDTPLGATEPGDFMMWTSMMNWLGEWDSAKSVGLKVAGLAVRNQGWGSNAIRPQEIEKVFLDPATQKLWVKVVFEPFVQLGPGVTDDDGDGRKEIYAALAGVHYTAEIINALANTYMKATFTTHGLSKEVSKSLNELYSTTGAQVERYLGQPFEVPGLGTITYPFVVLRHTGGQKNVILLGTGI